MKSTIFTFAFMIHFSLVTFGQATDHYFEGFLPSAHLSTGALLFQRKPSPYLREDKHRTLGILGELSLVTEGQWYLKKNVVGVGFGHTHQFLSINNSSPVLSIFPYDCDDCLFGEANYINSYFTIPVSYSRILHLNKSATILLYFRHDLSAEILYHTKLNVTYESTPILDDKEVRQLLSSFQHDNVQWRHRFGIGFIWRFLKHNLSINLRAGIQSILNPSNEEFVGKAYGGLLLFGVQYKPPKAMKPINRA